MTMSAEQPKTKASDPTTPATPFQFEVGVAGASITALLALIEQMLKNEQTQQKADGILGQESALMSQNKAASQKAAGDAAASAGMQACVSGIVGAAISLGGVGVQIGMSIHGAKNDGGLGDAMSRDKTTLASMDELPNAATVGTIGGAAGGGAPLKTAGSIHTDLDDVYDSLLGSKNSTTGLDNTINGTPMTPAEKQNPAIKSDLKMSVEKLQVVKDNVENGNLTAPEKEAIKVKVTKIREELSKNIKGYSASISAHSGKIQSKGQIINQFSSTIGGVGSSIGSALQAQGTAAQASNNADATNQDSATSQLKGMGDYYNQASSKSSKQVGEIYAMLQSMSRSLAQISSSLS